MGDRRGADSPVELSDGSRENEILLVDSQYSVLEDDFPSVLDVRNLLKLAHQQVVRLGRSARSGLVVLHAGAQSKDTAKDTSLVNIRALVRAAYHP